VTRAIKAFKDSPVRKALPVQWAIWDQLEHKVQQVCLEKQPIPEQQDHWDPLESKANKECLERRH
jgi:hypothetical protein